MADEIEVNEAPEEVTEEAPDIVVAPTIVVAESEPEAADYVTRAEFESYRSEHAESGHGDLREKIGVLAGIEALLIEDESQPEPVVEETTEIEPSPETQAEAEAETAGERHAGIWL